MKFYNKTIKIFALLLVTIVFIQCQKDYISPDNNYHSHRRYNQPINCWSSITDWTDLMSDSFLTNN
jgi:hypothetical protein